MEQTLAILKPEVLIDKQEDEIIALIKTSGFVIVKKKLLKLTKQQAQNLYIEHIGKNFFDSLVDYICSGFILAMILEKENAVMLFRELMGGSDLAKNSSSTLRFKYARNERENAVHGSDSFENAQIEIKLIFG